MCLLFSLFPRKLQSAIRVGLPLCLYWNVGEANCKGVRLHRRWFVLGKWLKADCLEIFLTPAIAFPAAGPVIMSLEEKMEADARSIYVGNVSMGI